MKVHSLGTLVFVGVLLLLLAWQLVQALWLGRMHDILFEDDDYLYFFESPFLFILQFAAFAGFAYMLVRMAIKEIRKGSAPP